MTKSSSEYGASADAIEYHYGTGNDYFALWLGDTMAYSSALWDEDNPEQTLDQAQRAKITHHIVQSGAHKADRVLDIGCGWGSVLFPLADNYKVKEIMGLTLSDSQVNWINGLDHPNIEARLESWRDHDPSAPYDSIISIGAFEHFTKLGMSSDEKVAVYREFFQKCHGWLNDGGALSLQTVGYDNALPSSFDEFLATEIFPETDTPFLAEICKGCEHLFHVELVHNHAEHYRRTLRAWYDNIKSNRDACVAEKGEEEVTRFEKYLRLCSYMYEVGGLALYRLTLKKINKPKVW